MKPLAVLVSLLSICLAQAFDARSECLQALNAAKKAGLPISETDLKVPKPSKDSIELEKQIDRASKLVKGTHPSGELVVLIDKIAASKAPRARSIDFGAMSHFPRISKMRALFRAKMTHAEVALQQGSFVQVVDRLQVARRLIGLFSTDDSYITAISQVALEQQYFAFIKKAAQTNARVAKSIPAQLLNPFPKPSIPRVLQTDFYQALLTFSNPQAMMSSSPARIVVPTDAAQLKLVTRLAKSWTLAYSSLKGAKSGAELMSKYKIIQPKLDRVKDEGDTLTMGPDWAAKNVPFDRSELRRQEALAALKGIG